MKIMSNDSYKINKTIYSYWILVDASGKRLGNPISVERAAYGTIEKVNQVTYVVNRKKERVGDSLAKIHANKPDANMYQPGWNTDTCAGSCFKTRIDNIDKFIIVHDERPDEYKLVFWLVYRSFDEYSDDQIVRKTKTHLRKYFKNIIDGVAQ
jgi:hypothetical protein